MLISPMIAMVVNLVAGPDTLQNAVVVADTGRPEASRPSSPKAQWRPGVAVGQKMAEGDTSVSVEVKTSASIKDALGGNAAQDERWKALQAQIDAREMQKHRDTSGRVMRNGVVYTKPESRQNVSSVTVPEKESEREYWWIPFVREQEIKRKWRMRDSIERIESYRSSPSTGIDYDVLGLRALEGWYRLRLGLVHAQGPRLWRLVVGAGVLRQVSNATLDSVRGRELTSGYEFRLWEERIVKGPGPLSFYFGFGPNLRWEFSEATVDSSQLGYVKNKHTTWVEGHYVNGAYVGGSYQNTYQSTHLSARSWAGSMLVGVGARIHSETGMALAGGMELGPELKRTSLSGDSLAVSGSGSKWSLLEPTWTVGVDWFF